MLQNKRRKRILTATARQAATARRRFIGPIIATIIALPCSLQGFATHVSAEEAPSDKSVSYDIASLQGQVVWYGPALQEQLGIQVVPEATERVLALKTKGGQLIPLIEDLRTRAFRQDERLREMNIELKVRRYQTTPALQILGVYEILDGKKYEIDYWCDVCAIPMYENGPCACCQADNRLRKRPVADDQPQSHEQHDEHEER